MESLRNDPGKACWSAIGLALTLCATAAIADAPKAAKPSGVMAFPNVTVVNAPATQLKPVKAAPSQAGARAYIDSSTGKLRPQNHEDRVEEAAAASSRSLSRTRSKAGVASLNEASGEPEMIYGADNSVTVLLTEEHMTFQVAHKGPAGLQRMEVTGKKAAEKAAKSQMSSQSHVQASAEVNHAR